MMRQQENTGQGTGMCQSHVVDPNGNLLHVYHGSKSKFSEFDLAFCDNNLAFGAGFYFTPTLSTAESYAKGTSDQPGYVYDCFVFLRNPYRSSISLQHKEEFAGMNSRQIRQKLIDEGYDGVLHVYWDGSFYEEAVIVAFYPEQIRTLNVDTTN